MIAYIQTVGALLSLSLFVFALYIRFSKRVDTTSLSADWSLLLIAAAGLQMLFYFIGVSLAHVEIRAALVMGAAACYITALVLWFVGSVKGAAYE